MLISEVHDVIPHSIPLFWIFLCIGVSTLEVRSSGGVVVFIPWAFQRVSEETCVTEGWLHLLTFPSSLCVPPQHKVWSRNRNISLCTRRSRLQIWIDYISSRFFLKSSLHECSVNDREPFCKLRYYLRAKEAEKCYFKVLDIYAYI